MNWRALWTNGYCSSLLSPPAHPPTHLSSLLYTVLETLLTVGTGREVMKRINYLHWTDCLVSAASLSPM